jgi:hypothetical protein
MLVLSLSPTAMNFPKQFVRCMVPPSDEATVIDFEVVNIREVHASVGIAAPKRVLILRSELIRDNN